MKRVLGVNGIYNLSWSTESFTDKILNRLGGVDPVDVAYPFMLAILAYSDWAITRRAKRLLAAHKPGDCVVAHSFGCLVTIYAMRMGAKFDTVFFFGAAAESSVAIPNIGARVIYNIYSQDDTALRLGKSLPGHPFGEMGRVGYQGNCQCVVNINAKGHDHNSYVEDGKIGHWLDFIQARLES